MKDTLYFVASAPGHYGDTTRVMSSHYTLDAARKACGSWPGLCVRRGALRKGDTLYSDLERTYPIVPRATTASQSA